MPRPPIIDFDRSYTFSNYFDLPNEPGEIVAEFGYELNLEKLKLPRTNAELDRLSSLRDRIESVIPYVNLTSEVARREVFIAPILIDVVYYTRSHLSMEYPISATEQLKGNLDYYLRKPGQMLIVEAKKADLDRGFTQLAVELIALDHWLDCAHAVLTGAVSTGSIWVFGQLDRANKQITQDLNLYTVPANLEDLLRVLVAILEPS